MNDMHSDRLSYREINAEDAALIVKWRSDPEVYKYFTRPCKITVEEHINWFLNSYSSDPNRLDFMALDSGLSKVGVFGIRRESESSDEAEVSYILAPEFYGRGFATEGVKWIMGYCKEHWGISNVIAEIHKENIRSINLAESVGFKESENRGLFIRFSKCL